MREFRYEPLSQRSHPGCLYGRKVDGKPPRHHRSTVSDRHTEIFDQHRETLVTLAYEMLGRIMEAEDVVQEAYLRWRDVDLDRVEHPESYLSTTVTHLCLDRLDSAQERRESYPGPWLPEPLRADDRGPETDPAVSADALTTAFLMVMESLTPVQRAIYLLREVFGYGYDEIARIVEKSEAACRQHVHRARERLEARDRRYEPSPDDAEEVAEEFLACCRGRDPSGLMELLAEDAVSWSDGGDRFRGAARRPVEGVENIARLLVGAMDRVPEGTRTEVTRLNGHPAVVFRREGDCIGAFSLNVDGEEIAELYLLVNPEKLRHLDTP